MIAKKEYEANNIIKRTWSALSNWNKILLRVIATLVAILGCIGAYKNLSHNKNSDKVTKEEILSKKIENFKQVPRFEFKYYSFDSKYYFLNILRKGNIDFANSIVIENDILNEYLSLYPKDSGAHIGIDNYSLMCLNIKQTSELPVFETQILVNTFLLKNGLTEITTTSINSLSSHESFNKKSHLIDIGDINNSSNYLIPLFIIFKRFSNENPYILIDSATSKRIIQPEVIKFKSPIKNSIERIEIRGIFNNKKIINLYVKGLG
jgi:hypothetical protein